MNPQDDQPQNNQPQSAGNPAEQAPLPQAQPQAPVASQPQPYQQPAPMQPSVSDKQGMFITLLVLNVLFFIPAVVLVGLFHQQYKKDAQAGNMEKAKKNLGRMQLWGWIGVAVGILIFIAYFASNGSKS